MKKVIIFVSILLVVLTASAQSISQQEAMERVVEFLQSAPAKGSPRRAMVSAPKLETVATDLNHVYVFNINGGGYVIASGDERAVPVLGYSTTGTLDWQHMPENKRGWLQSYNEAIRRLPSSAVNASAQSQKHAARAVIRPLLTTQWNQSPVYNDLCPVYKGQVAKYYGQLGQTGCTATAMAQIINYYKWPQAPISAIPAYDYITVNLKKDLVENFHADELPPVTLDWNNMRNRYLTLKKNSGFEMLPDVTAAQRTAVATLMQYCGHSIQMNYGPEFSGAWAEKVPLALVRYFGYDKGIQYVDRYNYTVDQWEQLVYDELAAQRPVLYSASSDDGHTFICDGYDGQGLFHINWGWEGVDDEYFSLSILNSNSYSKEVEAGWAFNNNQAAVIGCQPSVEGSAATNTFPRLKQVCPYDIRFDGMKYTIQYEFRYHSLDYQTATFQIELFYYDERDKKMKQFSQDSELLDVKEGVNSVFAFPCYVDTDEPDSEYALYAMARWLKPDGTYDEWKSTGDICFWRWVKNGKVTIAQCPYPEFKVTDFALHRGTGAVKTANELALTLKNGENEFQGTLVLVPYFIGSESPEDAWEMLNKNNSAYPIGNSMNTSVFLRANATENVYFTFTPEKEGTYLMLLYDISYGVNVLDRMAISFPGGTTGIQKHVAAGSQPADGAYYNFAGQRVSNPHKGLYIVNGKKHFVK